MGRRNRATSLQGATRSVARLLEADMPLGMWNATANATAKAPTLGDIRDGSFTHDGWEETRQVESRRGSLSGSNDERRSSISGRTRSGTGNARPLRNNTTALQGNVDEKDEHRYHEADVAGLGTSAFINAPTEIGETEAGPPMSRQQTRLEEETASLDRINTGASQKGPRASVRQNTRTEAAQQSSEVRPMLTRQALARH